MIKWKACEYGTFRDDWRLFAGLLDVVLRLVGNNHWRLVGVGSVMLLHRWALGGWASRDYSAVQRIVLVQTDDFNRLAMGRTFVVRRLVLNNSHATGFHCTSSFQSGRRRNDSDIVMSWICRTRNTRYFRDYLPAGARPATFCFDSSSDILNACY